MNTFKNYGCPKGAPGAMGVDYAQLEKTISFAMHQFMAKREEILLGGKPEPPEVTGYKVYIYYNGGAAEFWLWRDRWETCFHYYRRQARYVRYSPLRTRAQGYGVSGAR